MLVLLYSIRVVGNANSANYTSIYDFGINICMKTLREMMDLIESAQQDVAEGWTKLPSGDYQNSHTGVRTSKPSQKKKRGEKTGAEWDAIEKAKKDKEQGVSEGFDELYQQAIRKYTQRVANDYLGGGNAHLYGAGNFDSEMFGVDPKQAEQDFDRLFPQYLKKLQGGKQLEETTPDAIAKIEQLTRK
jgi:hypothetical protein